MSGLEVVAAHIPVFEEKEDKKCAIYPWLADATPLDQLTLQAKKSDDGTRKLDARNYLVKSPTAETSRLSGKRGSARLVFALPPIDVQILNDSRRPVVSRFIRLPQLEESKSTALPALITYAAVTKVVTTASNGSSCGMLVRTCLVEGASKRPIPLGAHAELLQQTTLEQDTSAEFGPLLVLGADKDGADCPRVLACTVDAKESCEVHTQRPHAAFVQRLASLNYKELETEIERSAFELDTPDGKTKTDFVRVRLPVERGAQPANALQWLLFSFWYTLASETAAEMAKSTHATLFKEQWFQKEPPSVLVHRDSLRRVIRNALVRAGRSGTVIDAKEGIAIALRGLEQPAMAAASGTVAVTVFVDIEYALFASPESIHFEGGVPLPTLVSSQQQQQQPPAATSTTAVVGVRRFGRVVGAGRG